MVRWIIVVFSLLVLTGSAFAGEAKTPIVSGPPVPVTSTAVGEVKVKEPPIELPKAAVDKNLFESGRILCAPEAEGMQKVIAIAGFEGTEDVIWCKWWKLGTVDKEPVIIWKCNDSNSRWAILCGNDRWWNGDLTLE